jgi:hypothetical protein
MSLKDDTTPTTFDGFRQYIFEYAMGLARSLTSDPEMPAVVAVMAAWHLGVQQGIGAALADAKTAEHLRSLMLAMVDVQLKRPGDLDVDEFLAAARQVAMP